MEMNVLGLMSGTSLDGLDLCLTSFSEGLKEFEIQKADTIEMPAKWRKIFASREFSSPEKFYQAHIEFGTWLGKTAKNFLEKNHLEAHLIGSHGHTIWHNPAEGYTVQLGHGQSLACAAGIPTVADFRTKDVCLGGQGAPLVPIGDMILFGQYDQCLNLGGMANISCTTKPIKAFDICPFNTVMNHLASALGLDYDHNGEMAAQGELDKKLLLELDLLPYYNSKGPKSLGIEWVESEFIPVIEKSKVSIQGKLRTCCEHFARKIAEAIESLPGESVLVSGGGAFNKFALIQIQSQTSKRLDLPEEQIIQFKESLIFGLLAYLHVFGQNNVMASVTGGLKDHVGGVYFKP